MKSYIGTYIKRESDDLIINESVCAESAVSVSGVGKVQNCPTCAGKSILEVIDCAECDGSSRTLHMKVQIKELSNKDIESNYTIFEKKDLKNKNLDPTLTSDELEALRGKKSKASVGSISQDHEAAQQDQNSTPFNILKWLMRMILLYLLIMLLLNGCEFIRNKKENRKKQVKKEQELLNKQKKKKVLKTKNKTDGKMPRKRKAGMNYDFAPIEVWQNYGNMNFDSLSKNKSLNEFMRKNFKRGQLKKNRQVMSEKGIYKVCSDFGAFSDDCRNKWFKERKIRQTFVDKIEQIYKEEGENLFE